MYPPIHLTYGLILVLRSQFFDYLRETFFKHALEHLEAARSENKGKQCFLLTETPDYFLSLRSPVIGQATISALEPVLGPQQKTGSVTLFHCSWRSA